MKEEGCIAQPVTSLAQRHEDDPYPAVSSFILAIIRNKQLNNELSVYPVGQRYVSEGRAFGPYLTSTACNVELFLPKFKEDIKNNRCRVCRSPITVTEDPMDFTRFIDHLEQLREQLLSRIEQNG